MIRRIAGIYTALLMLAMSGPAFAAERYEILISYETKSEGEMSSGSSRGSYLYVEEVHARENGCLERSFDIVDNPGQPRPLVEWQVPVRLLRCGPDDRKIVNEAQMIARRDHFLEEIEATMEVCGKHYFTWMVFKIECDPRAILETIDRYDLVSLRLEDGANYTLSGNSGKATLSQVSSDLDEQTFVANGQIDPAFLRAQELRQLEILEELSGSSRSSEEMKEELAAKNYSGEFTVTFAVGPALGEITRTIVQEMQIIDANGSIETRWREEITQRKRVEPMSESDPS